MLTIELRFPAGRYHATPWDRHVNEGAIEWPPSPWRILRALVATWHLKAWQDLPFEHVARLVEELATAEPHYDLPVGTASHTRHYVPLYRAGSTTKIFDTFVQLQRNARILVIWPRLELSPVAEDALDILLGRLGYLGRAESWVEGRRLTESEEANCYPLSERADLGPEQEIVRMLAPKPPTELQDWSSKAISAALEQALAEKRTRAASRGKDPDKVKLSAQEKRKARAELPTTVAEALSTDSGDLRDARWSDVPGARWLDYVRPRSALTIAPQRTTSRTTARRPTVARFAVASQVPPRLTEAISVAERVRMALLSLSNGAPVFSGKDEKGSPATGHHHAYFLPEANASHGRITHVTLHAPMGFDDDAQRALESLRRVWGRDNHDLQLVPLGIGQPEDFAGQNTRAGECPLLVECSTWVSRTPFVNTRHPKASRRGLPKLDASGHQVGSAEHELRRLLAATNRPRPTRLEPITSTNLSGKSTSWREFRTERRQGEGRRGPDAACGFSIVFPRPVRGPLVLGYGAHFGLGVFTPAG